MKKIILLIILGLSLVGCKKTYNSYYYNGWHSKEINKKFQISGHLINSEKEKSYLDRLSIFERGDAQWPTVVTPIIIKENGKKYTINKKQGSTTTYFVYKNGVKINSDNFIVEFGKIKLENGQIIELPPIKFIKRVHITKVNPVLDALNQDTREDPFQGTIEEYREWKKRNR